MFSAEHYNFQFPLFVSSIHMVVQFSFAGLSLLLVPSIRPPKRPTIKDYMYVTRINAVEDCLSITRIIGTRSFPVHLPPALILVSRISLSRLSPYPFTVCAISSYGIDDVKY